MKITNNNIFLYIIILCISKDIMNTNADLKLNHDLNNSISLNANDIDPNIDNQTKKSDYNNDLNNSISLNANDINPNIDNQTKKSDYNPILVSFDLQSKSLSELILALSEIKKINILIPASLETEKIIINFSTKNQILLEEVEEYLLYFLSMAGYILTLQDDIYVVTKKNIDDHLRRYNLPLYVNIKPEDLPDNIGYIRTIHFLKHIKVPIPSGQGSESIKQILFFLLPDKQNGIMVDPRTNSIILTGPSNAIAAAMLIIDEIDNFGNPDYVFHMPIKHLSVSYLTKLLDDLLSLSKESNPVNPSNLNGYSGPSFFSPQIKIVPDNKQNALIFLGKKEAIEKIVTFIKNEIDIPESHGNSVIHVYELKYLDSKKIAPILQDLVNGTSTTGTEQSVKDSNISNQYRKFDNVRIIPEEVLPAKRNNINGTSQTKLTLGGNKLIISATKDDYKELEKIIKILDQPQPQVIIEIVILDVQYDEMKNISSDTRLPSIINLPEGAQMQSLMWDNSRVMLNNPGSGIAISNPAGINSLTTMDADLLSGISSGDGANSKLSSLINNSARNGLIISLSEKYKNLSIWSILQLEETAMKRNVIENPTIITQNNTTAKIQNVVVKRGAGELSPNNTQYGGATVVNIQSYTASLGIHITPRINFGSCNNITGTRLNLEINMAIEDFKDDSQNDFTKYNRALKTNANVKSGDLLVLGGLHKQGLADRIAKVPFLGDIPLIGGLFRKTVQQESDSNLIVIIRATIVENDEELAKYTYRQSNYLKSELNENILAHYKKDINRITIS
jgi:general secretion pathway protein D